MAGSFPTGWCGDGPVIAELELDGPGEVLLVLLDEVAITQLERPAADVPLRGRVVWADGMATELAQEHVLLSLRDPETTWWQRPGPAVTCVPERREEPLLVGVLRALR
jgi:hypothetical protein